MKQQVKTYCRSKTKSSQLQRFVKDSILSSEPNPIDKVRDFLNGRSKLGDLMGQHVRSHNTLAAVEEDDPLKRAARKKQPPLGLLSGGLPPRRKGPGGVSTKPSENIPVVFSDDGESDTLFSLSQPPRSLVNGRTIDAPLSSMKGFEVSIPSSYQQNSASGTPSTSRDPEKALSWSMSSQSRPEPPRATESETSSMPQTCSQRGDRPASTSSIPHITSSSQAKNEQNIVLTHCARVCRPRSDSRNRLDGRKSNSNLAKTAKTNDLKKTSDLVQITGKNPPAPINAREKELHVKKRKKSDIRRISTKPNLKRPLYPTLPLCSLQNPRPPR